MLDLKQSDFNICLNFVSTPVPWDGSPEVAHWLAPETTNYLGDTYISSSVTSLGKRTVRLHRRMRYQYYPLLL